MKKSSTFIVTFIISLCIIKHAEACTNFIVSKGASAKGSVMISYSADSHIRYGYLFHYPSADHPAGSMVDIIHYESGKLLGSIPEVPHTFNVVGLMNEHQLAMGETTFGGLDSLSSQPGALLDYGSLMKLALQRARTAREAIRIISELASLYGYASGGESFSISDANEAWIMEIIGKGKYEKGAVWVAMQIPEGCISGHANQARITFFPFQKANKWSDPKQTCFHSPDVISFAKAHGFFRGKDTDFSFSDVFNPVNVGGARFCDSRIWSFFRKYSSFVRDNDDFADYALGRISYDAVYSDGRLNPNAYATNRPPLWVKADHKIDLAGLMACMRDHFEDSPLDMRYDAGAGPFQCPYRWRPMEFDVDGHTYCNERAVATQQTGYSFVAESRNMLPDPIGGIFWMGVDDADGCVYAPMYCSMTEVPEAYAFGKGSMIKWSDKSAFWTFNLVNNFAYSRYNVIHPEIEAYQQELEQDFFESSAKVDSIAKSVYSADPADAVKIVTTFSVDAGNQLQAKWLDFFHYLFMKYMDGNIKQTSGHTLTDNGNGKGIPPKPAQPGYGKEWERNVAEKTGERLKIK